MKVYCLALFILGNMVALGAEPDWRALRRAVANRLVPQGGIRHSPDV
jgi:hypothetical protein